MSQTTKRALAASLKQIMAVKPLSKITIADITEDCGISRMTFYYHFQDIYDLIDWICQEEGSKALLGRKSYETWQAGLISLYDTIRENRVFVESVYRSIQRDKIENYLFQVVYGLLYDVVHQLSKDSPISQEDQQYITHFYKYAFVGVTLDWVKGGMKEPPEEVVGRISRMIHGQLLSAIQNMAAPSPSGGEGR